MSGDVSMPTMIDPAAWPEPLSRLRSGFAGQLNVYRVMAHHPALLIAWETFRNHVVLDNALGRQGSEVVILRTAHRWGSAYEWSSHIVRARACGFSDARIDSIRATMDAMDPSDATLARAVDELIDDGRLSAETAASIQRLVGTAGLLDLMATVGMYSTLAFIVNTCHAPIESAASTR